MSQTNRVLHSFNAPCGNLCVDVFCRPDGSFGFEEYRRDVEDMRGWFAIGHYEQRRFPTETRAVQAAQDTVAWLEDVAL